jgi:hypothetical protein
LCSCAHPFVEFSLVLGDCCFLLIYLVRKLSDPLWIEGRIAYGRFEATKEGAADLVQRIAHQEAFEVAVHRVRG